MRIRRDLLLERCLGHCEVGGEPLPAEWAVHHRKLRSRGGDNRLANLMAVCHDHHNLKRRSIHLSVHWATSNGWMVYSDQEPSQVILQVFGKWTYLDDTGGYRDPSPALEEVIQTLRSTR